MTPQVAARLRIHEDDGAVALPRHRRQLALAAEAPAALPVDDVAGVDLEAAALPSVLSREALHRRLLGMADVLAATLALVVVLSMLGEDRVALVTLAGMPLVLVLFKIAGLYDRDELQIVHSTLDEAPLLLQLTGLFALSVAILEPIILAGSLSGEQIGALWLAAFAAVAGGRVAARSLAGRLSPVERCLVIGEVGQVERIRVKLAATNARTRVVASLPLAGEDVDVGLGSPSVVRRVVRDLEVHRIIIAPTTTDANDVVALIRMAKAVGVRVSVLPRIFEAVGSAVEFDDVDGMTMLGIRRFGLPRSSRVLKRAFDVVATSIGLVIVGPVLAAIALAVRLDSNGPIFFRQVRVGRDGEHFRIFKFRSMVADADGQKDALRALNEAGDGLFKIADDPRVTRVGRFLRHTSLDELPQVFNVLRGEMSLVGPRPLVVDEDAQVLGMDRSRLHLTPGMTGPWQVLGSRVPIQEMVGIDYLYVANWSLWLDLKLLLRTARHVVRGRNL
jgi:exopolysaccharide biosynthesis polyprenyl glycosylphosphotransferase